MLRVTLVGNTGSDSETRYSAKGKQIVSFSVAVNQVSKGPDGERRENTEWFRCKVSGYQAEYAQRLTKGSRVLVMGRLDISHFQGRDGEPRTGFDVWADEIQSMTPREKRDGEGDDDGDSRPASRPAAPAGAGRGAAADDDNDLPF